MSRRIRGTLLPLMYRCSMSHRIIASRSCPYQSHRRHLSVFSTTSLRTEPLPTASSSRSIRNIRARFNPTRKPRIKDERVADDDPSDRRYELSVGIIIERIPRYLCRPPQWEVDWEEFLRNERLRMSGPVPEEIRAKPVEAAVEFVDISTADDTADNRRSLDREQDDSLVLLIKRNDRTDNQWHLPTITFEYHHDTQKYTMSMREAAEQTAKRWFSSDFKLVILGNAPVAYHKYNYTPEYISKNQNNKLNNNNNNINNQEIIGKKLYLFHAIHLSGIPQFTRSLLSDKNNAVAPADDYVWIKKQQFGEYITDPQLTALLTDVIVSAKEYNAATP